MNSSEKSYSIDCSYKSIEKTAEDAIYKLAFEYINQNSQKSQTTKEFYARKYARFCSLKKKSTADGLVITESDRPEINTLFPELFRIPFPQPKNPSFTFIDLFSGIGGFHQAMHQLNGKCLLASEIDTFAVDTYLDNYGIDSNRSIKDISDDDFPKHDVLCAGFPCQTFSKAGKQAGFADQTKGTLFFEIIRILKNKKIRPKYFILENVRNLLSHDKGNTWRVIQDSLDIYTTGIIDENPDSKYNISEHEEKVLTCWNEFYNGIKQKVIGFPIWISEFRSNHDTDDLPEWKAEFCKKNRNLYTENKDFIDGWLKKWNGLDDFTPTERKFEWQAGENIKSIWEGFIQYRPSGIRVKRPSAFPALVAIVQIPIIGKYRRRLTPREAARLQSFPDAFMPNTNEHQAYKQFGNAVNVNCVKFLAEQLFKYGEKN